MARTPPKPAAAPEPPKFGDTVYVAPLTDPAVRAPVDGARLPPEGRAVTWSEYWHRRLLDGDIELAEAPPEEPEAPAPESKPLEA